MSANRQGIAYSDEHRRFIASLYDGGVAYTDAMLGALLDLLEARNLLEDALVVVLADHGEEFQEHGLFLHQQVYEETARVPLLLRFPGGVASRKAEGSGTTRALAALNGERHGSLVQLVDVMPTLLSYLDIEIPASVQGVDLLPQLMGKAAPREFVYLTNQRGTQTGVSDGRWKLIRETEAGTDQLFDLSADPGEHNDLAASQPERAKALGRRLDEQVANNQRAAFERPRASELDPEIVRGLRAIGYAEE
jgi:arylsulfatase A-like enzyme